MLRHDITHHDRKNFKPHSKTRLGQGSGQLDLFRRQMKSRHAVFEDRDFWCDLEFALTRWLMDPVEKELRGFWIDGFIPEGIHDTKYGASVEGVAWVGTSGREQHAYQFVVSIPQSLLASKSRVFHFSKVVLNPDSRTLEITIERGSNNAEQSDSRQPSMDPNLE